MEHAVKWDPAKYVEFGNHRDRPFFDLTSRILAEDPRHVVDLGCGPGNLTATLATRWPRAVVVGLDSSADMLAKAHALAAAHPTLSFVHADIAGWTPEADTDVGQQRGVAMGAGPLDDARRVA
jgi:trans-aconitate 2-methyltransferase